ncbi:DUF5329 family protein [Rivibacter subsaxonicus]|uniref:DUF5329 domain-containing protein n=1 Tax=Rivibacter subsaxonicus TaxID=457575 RepID=A0A4V2FUH3_9BURK|nr:DUF5329 family protein [Rivibacter subsaxonicus]RZU02026.1 hypothetical protein EV670_0044 [Rivibacter subsaxonicus]
MLTRRALLLGLLAVATVAGAAPSAAEQARIDALVDGIEREPSLKFVRNGRGYGAIDAARFLREKQKAMGDKVRSAEDFIEQIATRSSTTGQPYLIRFADGREQPAAEFLRARLAPR